MLMVFSILFNYGAGLLLAGPAPRPSSRALLFLAVLVNLALLGVFKYANFFTEIVNNLLGSFGIPALEISPLHLPIGISFFTFQAISYIVDIYRGQARVQRNPLDCGLYIALFPQLIAGPIVRYHDIVGQLRNRKHTLSRFHSGAVLFIIGLGKKMLLANPMGGVADQIFQLPAGEIPLVLAWSGAIAYTLQIYFDFSGYSDMAIGLGRMFGFELLANFNYPYNSRSFREFWQRWHISLSRWFRDYLYIPLGGSRDSARRTIINLWTVFLLCGLWHGASWTFVLWGVLHGTFLIGERFLWGALLTKTPDLLRRCYLLTGVLFTWVFFRAETITAGKDFVQAMLGANGLTSRLYPLGLPWNNYTTIVLGIAILGASPLFPWVNSKLAQQWPAEQLRLLWCLLSLPFSAILFIVCALELAAGTHNPFIYFRF